jgi:hypothetical protein
VSCVWINRRPRKGGGISYRVMFRIGGHEISPKHAGAFPTKREAEIRKQWVAGEIAAKRFPDSRLLAPEPVSIVILNQIADGWRIARIDLSEGTRQRHEVELARVLSRSRRICLPATPVDLSTADDRPRSDRHENGGGREADMGRRR